MDQLFFGKMRTRLLIDGIGHMIVRHQRHRLGPSQRRPLAIAKERGLAPGIQRIQPLLGLSPGPGVLGMHVQAVGASVDLRSPHLHQFDQRWL